MSAQTSSHCPVPAALGGMNDSHSTDEAHSLPERTREESANRLDTCDVPGSVHRAFCTAAYRTVPQVIVLISWREKHIRTGKSCPKLNRFPVRRTYRLQDGELPGVRATSAGSASPGDAATTPDQREEVPTSLGANATPVQPACRRKAKGHNHHPPAQIKSWVLVPPELC